MAKNPKWGGRRPSAGRPRQNLTLSKSDARSLLLLTKHRRALFNKPELTEEDVVGSLVEQAWKEVDQAYQEAAEVAQESSLI